MTEYRFNPGWMAQCAFASSDGDLTASDLGVLVEILGRFGAMTSDEDRIAAVRMFADAPPDTVGYSVEIPHDDARRVGAFRTIGHARKGIDRIRHATVCGLPLFRAVDVTDAAARYHLLAGPGAARSHHAFGKIIKRDGSRPAMETYRQYVTLDADLIGRFKSSLSLPVLARALAWIRANATTGLPEASAYRHDRDDDAFTFNLAPVEVPDVFGFRIARTRPNYLLPALDRIRDDLRRANISMRVTSRSAGGTVAMIGIALREIRDVGVDMDPADPHDVRYDGLPTSQFKRPPTTPVRSEVFSLMDAEPYVVEPVAATIIEPAPDVTERPVRPRGRMTGIVVADAEDVAPVEPVAAPLPVDDGRNALKPIAPPVIPRAALALRDVRPPWLRRRLVHKHPMLPGTFADRPLDTYIACEDAYRVGVHVWTEGLGSRPERIEGVNVMDGAVAVGELWKRGLQRKEWANWVCTYPGREWEPEDDQYLNMSWEDPEDDLPASRRTKPRDPMDFESLPHDGLGYVDDEGNPVDRLGRPMDRSDVEQEWDDRIQTPVDVV